MTDECEHEYVRKMKCTNGYLMECRLCGRMRWECPEPHYESLLDGFWRGAE